MLITLLVRNRLYLNRLHPYNAVAVFKDNCDVTLNDKKRFCIFLDLVKSLIFLSELKQEGTSLSLFGAVYDDFTTDQFLKILAKNIPNLNNHLSFTFNKVKDVEALKSVLNKLDEKKMYALFEKVEALKKE